MSHSENFTSLPNNFEGLVRLFPLPNLVMFPRVVQPLHVFEPRYCDLLEEAMATDQLITMALLKPGWEQEYEGRPPLEPIACIGRVVTHTRLPDNKHNVLLIGLQRARIVYELPVSAAFRRARVELLHDELNTAFAAERAELRSQLIDLFRQVMPRNEQVEEQLNQLLGQELDLGLLTDIIAFTAGFEPALKQKLLAETNVDQRTMLLVRSLQSALKRPETILPHNQSDFPPPFSAN
jgi:ATP-dependent Lon protease